MKKNEPTTGYGLSISALNCSGNPLHPRPERGSHDADVTRTVTIRTEPHSVMQAINRQIAHYSYHVGQITFLAKHFAAQAGQRTAVTIPRKQSGEFNTKVASGQASQR